MPYSGLLPWILTSVVASVASIVSGAHAGQPLLSWAGALTFACVLIAASLELNRPYWGIVAAEPSQDIAAGAFETNLQLVVLAYTWGGLAMFAVYRLTGLQWRHGWQYAAGMGLIAVLLQAYASVLAPPRSLLRQPRALDLATWAGLLQAVTALVGIIVLLLSGKMTTGKSDWPANQIFIAGGIAITVLGVLGAYTHVHLTRMRQRTRDLVHVSGR